MIQIRKNVLIILGFFAEWFLFTFSLQQTVIELDEQRYILDEIELTSEKYRDVSPLYWVFPPLKVWIEKRRAERILHDITVKRGEFDELFDLTNRAIAWAYLAVAEIFISVIATEEVLEIFNIQLSNWKFVGLNLFFVILGILIVVYRTSDFMKNRLLRRYTYED